MKSDKKAKELSAGRAKRSRKPKPRDGGRISLEHVQSSGLRPEEAELLPMLEALKPHDHLCLIYESKAEWRAAVVPFISAGLKRGEKCLYIVDTSTADEIRTYLGEEGVDVASAEDSGQLAILNETDAYTPEGLFDPDRMIALLIAETEKAVAEGFPALRATGEMTWVLRGYPGSERLLEYEAKLNRDFFPRHPCLAICQYDRWKFNPEIIKGVVMTHPLLINQNKVYRNFYYIPPAEFLTAERAKIEVQHWLNNLEREKLTWQDLREREEKMRSILRAAPIGIGVVVDRVFKDVNQRFCDLTGYIREELINKSARMVYPSEEEYQFVGREKYRQIADRGTGAVETRFRRKDGRVIDVWLSSTPLDTSDLSRGVTFTALDITERKKAEETLRISEARLKEAQRIAHIGSWEANLNTGKVIWSDEMYRIYGVSPDRFEPAAETIAELVHPQDRDSFLSWVSSTISGKKEEDLEFRIILPDGTTRIIRGSGELVFGETGEPVRGVGTAQDITESKKVEETLKRKMEELASLSRASQTVTASLDVDKVLSEIVVLAGKVADSDYASVVLVDEDGHIIGRSAETLPGGPALEYRARGDGFTHWIIQSRRTAVVDDIGEDGGIRSDLEEGAPTTVNLVLPACGIKSFVGLPLIFKERLLGVLYLHSLRPRVSRDRLPLLTAFANQAAVAVENANLYDEVQRELAERKVAEEKLRAALDEREVMLREIHHRVKNNIQIISSLLRLQSRYIKDEKALELLDESQNRIRSMALIHEKLYQSEDLSRIDFSDYIAKMITHLFAIYKIEFSRIRHRVDANKIQLDINRAIPCGLIINELITNALKHAFPEDREGELIINMHSLAGNQYELTVKDNGVGLQEGFDPAKKGTLGFQIVNDLVKQLDGSIEIRSDTGTGIVIRF